MLLGRCIVLNIPLEGADRVYIVYNRVYYLTWPKANPKS